MTDAPPPIIADAAVRQILAREGYLTGLRLPDGRMVFVAPLLFGRARLVLADAESVLDGW